MDHQDDNQPYTPYAPPTADIRSESRPQGGSMKLAIGGVCANLLGVVGIYFNAIEVSEEFAMNFTLFALAFWALSAFGLILMATGKRKLGGVLTIIGAVLFVPLGIIAILGARSAMNNGQSKDLDERRRLASTTSDSSG